MNYIPKNIINMFIALLIVSAFNILPDKAIAEENIPTSCEEVVAAGSSSTVLRAPLFDLVSPLVIYKVKVAEGQGLTVEFSDCCIQGDVYKIVMKQKTPFRTSLKGKEDRVGGSTCNPDEIATFPFGTLEDWETGRVKIKRITAISGAASAYIRFLSSGVVSVKLVKGAESCGFYKK